MDDRQLQVNPLLLRRRDALVAMGAIGLGARWLASKGSAAIADLGATENALCVLSPELTEGPYWVANHLTRRNVVAGRPGMPLTLRLTVVNATSCKAIPNADVEIWHADAGGVYSAVAGGGGGGTASPTDTTRFLRGHQRSNAAGLVIFDTIYPGWYPGRTPHIHLKVSVGGNEVHTGQLFFSDRVSDAVYRTAPYAARGSRGGTNASDGIFSQGGSASTLKLAKRATARGYSGAITLGVKAS